MSKPSSYAVFILVVVVAMIAAPAEAFRIFNYDFNVADFERSGSEFSTCANHSVKEIEHCVMQATGKLPYALVEQVYFPRDYSGEAYDDHYSGPTCCIKWTLARCLKDYLERVANSTLAPNCGQIREKLIAPLDKAVAKAEKTHEVCDQYRNQSATSCDAFQHLSCRDRYMLLTRELCEAPYRVLPVQVIDQMNHQYRNQTTLSEAQFEQGCCAGWDAYACMQRQVAKLNSSAETVTEQYRNCMLTQLKDDERRIQSGECGQYEHKCGYNFGIKTK